MMLESRPETKSHLIFSEISILQQKLKKSAKYCYLMLETYDLYE